MGVVMRGPIDPLMSGLAFGAVGSEMSDAGRVVSLPG